MYQFAETQDSDNYSFGRSITQFGMTVFNATDARQGKKYLVMILTQLNTSNHTGDVVQEHIDNNLKV